MKREKAQIMITKRDGKTEPLQIDKILYRIEKECYGLDIKWVEPFEVAKKVIDGIYDGVSSRQLDTLAMETAASLTTKHPDYSILAAHLAVTSMHKDTERSFSKAVKKMWEYTNPNTGLHNPLVSKEFYDIVMENQTELDSAIVKSRDFLFDYFGFKTMEKSYLLKVDGKVVERPQYMIMRTAIGIHGGDIDSVLKTYELISEGYFTHATPTLFNAGRDNGQLASCFLLTTEDSIEGIMDTLKDAALISKSAGGLGIDFARVRGKASYIAGTNGYSNGIIPFLKIYNEMTRAVDQGGGKRRGSAAIYLEPWHTDIFEFLDLRKNSGKEELRARDLFLALWTPDIFMQRVDLDQDWSLFDPNECPRLTETWGEEFNYLYNKYEKEGKAKQTVKARDVWYKVLESQIETGTPYMLYKDSINYKSNQSNIGIVRSSNLCLDGDTNIICKIDNKEITLSIKEIVNLFKENKNIQVLSRNVNTNVDEFQSILNAGITGLDEPTLKITDDTGNYIICTYEHQIWTENRGYVKAIDLVETDCVKILESIEVI